MATDSPVSRFLDGIGRWFAPAGESLAPGARIPDLTLPDDSGAPVNLAAAGATGWLLVYFYPRADTPGCTKQACSLRDSYAELLDLGARVFGVSLDSVERQREFRAKHHLPFALLADTKAELAGAFGVPHSFGFTRRQAFLFRDGLLVWKDLSAATDQQAADALAAIRATNP
ncbi:peroxiredoxin [Luteolibacter sp. LG18]|uniref:peroxiredoxin n=1 Tax=Luteolibacter sp. LG18 TaxID=2819286 RepID=UPI002B285E3A|nr:peroxiredoxin [Luteolibacter sp. LG18]